MHLFMAERLRLTQGWMPARIPCPRCHWANLEPQGRCHVCWPHARCRALGIPGCDQLRGTSPGARRVGLPRAVRKPEPVPGTAQKRNQHRLALTLLALWAPSVSGETHGFLPKIMFLRPQVHS